MNKLKLLEAIKGGLKGELESINNYKRALENADENSVVAFLEGRVEEEKLHFNYLLEYYNQINGCDSGEGFDLDVPELPAQESPIISAEFTKRIAEKQILFSCFSTAALLEKNAMDFYRACANDSEIPELKDFFEMMTDWEGIHYQDVLNIQKEAEGFFWEVNQFAPF